MKTFSLLGALLIALTAAFAQQMVSPPGQLSASPEPTAATAPSPEVAEKQAATPEAPTLSETPASQSLPAARKVAPVARRAKPKAASKPEARSQRDAPEPRGERRVRATLKQLENDWEAAIVAHNATAVAALLASDFDGVNAKGKFVNKRALISELKKDRDDYKSARNGRMNVRVYGPNIAVVTGSVRSKGMTKKGAAFDRTYRYTDTWVQRNDRWQCVASQDFLLGSN